MKILFFTFYDIVECMSDTSYVVFSHLLSSQYNNGCDVCDSVLLSKAADVDIGWQIWIKFVNSCLI